ncbi:hypothetical protein MUS1_12310 [Marinomonas ushuaiensis DSM 15871]|uniref:Apea-like HEPN domain-containing protein n=1 Tax=Marinomonas ushuaiensis DSM 15871 TaxID=1122207 RepID=X7E7N3_9GAMM|nr:hypothetical protein [Marinomonas ushuaiensis]ETX11178.1 hypothetical protein MUS1_12310 [Marinomonas ushuaiensis DSM 15871]
MEKPEEFVKIDLDDSLKKRIELHLELMDKHALNIIRSAAKIEVILNEAVKAKFVNEIGVQKVVGDSLARLIQLAFALGVIKQKTYESLLNFKSVRNRMAHGEETDLQVKDLLSMLLFLGSDAERVVQEKGSYLAEWHQISLEILVEHVEAEVNA